MLEFDVLGVIYRFLDINTLYGVALVDKASNGLLGSEVFWSGYDDDFTLMLREYDNVWDWLFDFKVKNFIKELLRGYEWMAQQKCGEKKWDCNNLCEYGSKYCYLHKTRKNCTRPTLNCVFMKGLNYFKDILGEEDLEGDLDSIFISEGYVYIYYFDTSCELDCFARRIDGKKYIYFIYRVLVERALILPKDYERDRYIRSLMVL